MPQPISSIKRILVVNIFGIGDVLFTTPLLENIKKNIPDAFIGYVCNRRAVAALENNSHVDRLYVYERDEYQELYRKSTGLFLKKGFEFFQDLKKEKFDLLIDLSLNNSVGVFAWLAGVPRRTGFNYKNRSLFLNEKITLKGYENRHVVEYYLDALEKLGFRIHTRSMRLPVSKDDELWADLFCSKQGLTGQERKIGIVPGGGASWGKDAVYKRWPAEKYAQLADKIIENFKTPIILLGDQNEADLCQQITKLMKHKAVIACGRTTVGQCAALFKRCDMAVVNDGGPLHIAVASGVKTVSIFGPVDEHVYGPYPRGNHQVVTHAIACRPCYRQFRRAQCDHVSCLKNIDVNDVFQKVRSGLTYEAEISNKI